MSGYSGKWHLPSTGQEPKDEFADVSTEELRVRAETQLATESAERAMLARNVELQKFFAKFPEVVDGGRNAGLLEARLRSNLQARGEVWPRWQPADLYQAVDELVESGAIQITGYKRQTPTYEELEKLSTAELKRRAGGQGDF